MTSSPSDTIYLDNAATSWPKPPSVLDAQIAFYRDFGVAAGRSGSFRAMQVQRTIEQCRSEIRQLINAHADDSIVFGFNGTDVLNMAIHGWVRPGDHVVATVVEHNSVLRPLEWLRQRQQVSISLAGSDERGRIDLDSIRQSLAPRTRLVIASHVSNVTGVIQPIEALGALCREHGVPLLVDACQSLGHIPVDVRRLQCDWLAASGHKGLQGPLGTGVLYLRSGVGAAIEPLRQGGTGTDSEQREQPASLPERLESGNPNSGGLFGLLAGVRSVAERGVEVIEEHERNWARRLCAGLREIASVRLICPDRDLATGIVSFVVEGHDPHELAMLLDSNHGIQVRAGLHCAPLMHRQLGTMDVGGTVRVSPGMNSTTEQIDRLLNALTNIRQFAISPTEKD